MSCWPKSPEEGAPPWRPNRATSIYLNASEVAAAADRHRYTSQHELLARVFRRTRTAVAAKVDASMTPTPTTLAISTVRSLDPAVLQAVVAEERPEKRQRLIEETAATAEAVLVRKTEEGRALAQVAHASASTKADETARDVEAAKEKTQTASILTLAALERLRTVVVASAWADNEARVRSLEAAEQATRCAEFEMSRREAQEAAEAANRSGDGLEIARARLEKAEQDEKEAFRRIARTEKSAEEARWVAAVAKEAEQCAEKAATEAVIWEEKECARSAELATFAAASAAVASACTEELQAAEEKLAVVMMAGPSINAELLSEVNTARGIRDEAAGIAAVPGFVPGDGRMRYREFSIGSTTFKFGGKLDARHAETGKMLEVKNRQTRLFYRTPVYERVQILVYLYVFQEAICTVRQCHAGQVNEEEIHWNEDEFRRLLEPGLSAFSEKLAEMDADASFRLDVLREHSER
jgi:hypothetical protein